MKYSDQNTDSLRIFVLEGDPSKDQFKVLEQSTLKWRNLSIDFGILGESHFITFNKQGSTFSEICACTNAQFDPTLSNLFFSDSLSKITSLPLVHTWEEYNYGFSYITIEYKRGKRGIEDLHSVKSSENFYSLEYKFPRRYFFSPRPVTEIYLKTTLDSVFIRTVHTYPNDKLAVFTNSALRIKR